MTLIGIGLKGMSCPECGADTEVSTREIVLA